MATRFAGELLQQRAGIRLQHNPYRGGGPALTDAMAGHVPVLVSGTGLVAPAVAEGAMRMLAVASAERSPSFPAVPTVAESGHPGFERSEWYGFVGPAGLPPAITARMNAAILEALRQPEAVAKYRELDMTTTPMSPAEFGGVLAEETARTTALVRAADITPR